MNDGDVAKAITADATLDVADIVASMAPDVVNVARLTYELSYLEPGTEAYSIKLGSLDTMKAVVVSRAELKFGKVASQVFGQLLAIALKVVLS
jgi:hypothetical protein